MLLTNADVLVAKMKKEFGEVLASNIIFKARRKTYLDEAKEIFSRQVCLTKLARSAGN